MTLRFPDNWLQPETVSLRRGLMDESDIVVAVSMEKATEMTRRCRDCAKVLDESVAAFSVNAGKYLFLFGAYNDEDVQKCVVLAKKTSAEWIRLKTVWVVCQNNIFEAVPYFAAEYFELNYSLLRHNCDVEFFYWVEDEMKFLSKNPRPSLKKKQALLRDWAEYMHRFNKLVSDVKKQIEAKRKTNSKPREEMTLNELLSAGEPIEIGEFNRALWKADYSDDIFREADKILYETQDFMDKDSDFLEAAILYDSLMGQMELKKGKTTAYNRRDRLIDLGNVLLHKWNGNDDWSEEEFRDFNIQTPMYALMSEIGESKVCSAISKVFRSIANVIIKKQIPFGVEMATLLLNCRNLCKRLPKELSESIRSFIEDEAMFQSYWDEVIAEKSAYGRLRKLAGIVKAFDYLGYSVEGSYTGELMERERREIGLIKDSRTMMAFCRLLPDYRWIRIDTEYLNKLYARISALQSENSSDADKLRFAVSKLLVLKKLGKTPYDALPESKGKIQDYTKTEIACGLQTRKGWKTEEKEPESKRKSIDERLADIEFRSNTAGYFIQVAYHDTPLREYCREKGIDYDEFKPKMAAYLDEVKGKL